MTLGVNSVRWLLGMTYETPRPLGKSPPSAAASQNWPSRLRSHEYAGGSESRPPRHLTPDE
jgi:hypothetical protein